jgi:putative flavoprotein involved in K+ transport
VRHEAVVIGAGQSGLVVSRCLQRRGVDHVVLERGAVGESWRSQRWDSFALNTLGWMNGLPDGEPLGDPEGFASAPELVGSFRAYVARHALPVQERTPVRRVRLDGDGFVVETDDDGVRARSVVLASGGQNLPTMPPSAAALTGTVSLHAAEYRRSSDLPDGRVLVVGSAQSGAQIAEDLLEAGREVLVSTGRAPRAPRRYRGMDVVTWFDRAGIWRQRPEDLPNPAMVRAPQPTISGTHGGHSVGLRSLASRGATMLGHVNGVVGTRIGFAPDLPDNLAFEDAGLAMIRGMVDGFIDAAGVDAPPYELDEADAPYDPPRSTPTELDVRTDGIAAVIWACGFGGDFSFVDVPGLTLDDRGVPLQRDGATGVAGLFVLGLPWLRNRSSGIILGVGEDAEVVAEAVAARAGL